MSGGGVGSRGVRTPAADRAGARGVSGGTCRQAGRKQGQLSFDSALIQNEGPTGRITVSRWPTSTTRPVVRPVASKASSCGGKKEMLGT